MSKRDLAGIARSGRLRAAINTGNRALVQQVDGELRGVSPALAQRLAREIGVPLETVIYTGAGKVFADARSDRWDVGFLAVDADRAQTVAFTRPYHAIEATYAVRADSAIRHVSEADQPGHSILVATASAYDLHLTRELKHAELIRAEAPNPSFDQFRAGRADLVGGVRASLVSAFGDDPAFRILPGRIVAVQQAMVLPHPDDARLAALDDFVERAIAEGFVADQIRQD